MDTLDNNFDNRPKPEDVSPWPTGSRYGLFAGLILIVVALGVHLTGMVDYTGQSSSGTWISTLINYGVLTAFIVLAVRQHRDQELGGGITFGRSFYVGFIVILVAGILSAIWGYVFFAFIEPDLIDQMMEMQKEVMMDQQGMSASDADKAMEMGAMFMSPGFFAIVGLLSTLFVGAIISLIVAAVMKNE